MRFAKIMAGVVINVEEWPGVPPAQGDGSIYVQTVTGGINDTYAVGVFTPNAVVKVPPSITRLQFITALQNAGAYGAVVTAINALPTGDATKIYFTNADPFFRTDPRLIAFATSMAYSPAQVDALFVAGALIAP